LGKWLSACRKLKLDPFLSPCTILTQSGLKGLNIRCKTLQLVHKRAWYTLEAIGIGKDFLSRTPSAQQLGERMNKWDNMKLQNFCTTKEMFSKLKRHPQSGRKYLLAIPQTKD
jgi:hypothetical protein